MERRIREHGPALAAEPRARQLEQAYRLTLKAQKILGTGNVEKARTQT